MSAVLNGRQLTVVRHGRQILEEVTVTLTPDSASSLDGALKAKPPSGILFAGGERLLLVDAAAASGAETLSFIAPAKGAYRITASRVGRPPGAYAMSFACE